MAADTITIYISETTRHDIKSPTAIFGTSYDHSEFEDSVGKWL